MSGFKFSFGQKIYLPIKRLFDIVFSLIFILLLSPVFLLLGIIVMIDTKSFPIFRQRRIGKKNKEFLILKFRSMDKNTPELPTHLLEDPGKYITKFGKFIRKTSLDELPQLFNIFIGQMSFIGPRPALWSQVDLINERNEKGVQFIKPGLTGWAQTHGRDEVTVEQKVELDYYYLKRFNVLLDIKILLLTIKNVITKKDVIEGKQS